MGKICCFAGHGKIYNYNEIRAKLEECIEKIIVTENISEFLVGNYGDFDRMAAGTVKKLKEKYPCIKLTLVIPYLTSAINNNKDYYNKNFDDILVAEIPESTPKRLGILKCNEFIVNKSDILIYHIEHSWGGAYKTLMYARKQENLKIVKVN